MYLVLRRPHDDQGSYIPIYIYIYIYRVFNGLRTNDIYITIEFDTTRRNGDQTRSHWRLCRYSRTEFNRLEIEGRRKEKKRIGDRKLEESLPTFVVVKGTKEILK